MAVDAEASRNVADEAMALCGPDGSLTGNSDDQILSRPLTEGVKESWDLIKGVGNAPSHEANEWVRNHLIRSQHSALLSRTLYSYPSLMLSTTVQISI